MPRDRDDVWNRIPMELRPRTSDQHNSFVITAPEWTRERLAAAMELPLHEINGQNGKFWIHCHVPYWERMDYGDVYNDVS